MIRIDMDIPMPETCSQCPMCYDYMHCRAKDIYFGKEDDWICETRPNWCQLQGIPDPKKHAGDNCCVCCGEIIPEGRQICPKCENSPVKPIKNGRAWECGKCNQILGIVGDDRLDSYCRSCGVKADWNDK